MVHTLKSVRKGYLEIKEDVSVKRTNRTTNTPSWPSIGSPAITNLVDESIDTIPSTSSFAGIWTLAWLRVESSFPPLLTLTNSQVNVWPTSAIISSRARSVMNWDVTPWKHWHNHGVTTCLFVCLFVSFLFLALFCMISFFLVTIKKILSETRNSPVGLCWWTVTENLLLLGSTSFINHRHNRFYLCVKLIST